MKETIISVLGHQLIDFYNLKRQSIVFDYVTDPRFRIGVDYCSRMLSTHNNNAYFVIFSHSIF